MRVVSTNIAIPNKLFRNGKEVLTGIFKEPLPAIRLLPEGVAGDIVVDTKYHGGQDKACYIYNANHYPYWEQKYGKLNWGMFGENLSIAEFHEDQIHIGDRFKIGEVILEISQPRVPCWKLGAKFKDPLLLQTFLNETKSGMYARIIEPGVIREGDSVELINSDNNGITVSKAFQLLTHFCEETLAYAMQHPFLAESYKEELQRKYRRA